VASNVGMMLLSITGELCGCSVVISMGDGVVMSNGWLIFWCCVVGSGLGIVLLVD
jgi:hypothetical protein